MLTTFLGYPRIGNQRQLKRGLEAYWQGAAGERELMDIAAKLRETHWKTARDAGIDVVPVNDFSLYDHMLDAAVAFGAVPPRFAGMDASATYFLMARGRAPGVLRELPPLEMTKWFDTNYHYLVPEIDETTQFFYRAGQAVEHFLEARRLGLAARPVLVGPVTFLALSKDPAGKRSPLESLDALLPAYEALLSDLAGAGADWVELDEPALVLDPTPELTRAYERAYERLARSEPRLLLATYFGGLGENLELAQSLPVSGLHVDALASPEACVALSRAARPKQHLSLGLVDGRNVWRTDLDRALAIGERVLEHLESDRIWVAPTCSLLHVPLDVEAEPALDPELVPHLAFARQKLSELELLRRGLCEGRSAIAGELEVSEQRKWARKTSSQFVDSALRQRIRALGAAERRRPEPIAERLPRQRAALGLPLLPTTTIGSFPQTHALRGLRARLRSGELSERQYDAAITALVDQAVELQHRLGLDVLVHGEPERNDMVEYFGEALDGAAVTRNGWVQSYGSRCVKPPILFGDLSRPGPMTVKLIEHAQGRTRMPVKGMLTGPVTLLKWSFVRDDEPLEHTCISLALALRDEIAELERVGIRVLQVDEPAFREALPLRRTHRADYLRWSVECFRLATAGVRAETQIHTHMCYSEFEEILDAIAALDADVVSIESARSGMDLVNAFAGRAFPSELGLGIYDIHSPRIPSEADMRELLERALAVLGPERIWVNPDCGLKTRTWEEAELALKRMVRVATRARAEWSRERAPSPVADTRSA